MRKGSKLLVAGVAALTCAGAVFAAGQDVHVLKVQMPDGSVQQIRYTGDVAPRIIVAQPQQIAEESDPFADMDRMFAAIDAQTDAMMRQVATLAAQAPAPGEAQLTRTGENSGAHGNGGAYSYSYVSSSSGANGGCTQSYEMTSYDGNQAPKVVSHQSGDCKGVPALVPTIAPQAAAVPKPGVTPTAATTPSTPKPPVPPAPVHAVKATEDAHVI